MEIIRKNSWDKILDNMIIIGGSARSGTTIMGKIINSLQNIEYYFEPPMLTPLLLKNDKLNLNEIKELLEFYFIDNFLLDCIAGRNINLNKNDDSCILHVKEEKEIQDRYKNSLSRIALAHKLTNIKFSFKLPEIVFHLDIFDKLYPSHKTILMHRNPNDVINSILKKRWFSDEYLYYKHPSQVYATRIIHHLKIPFWVEQKDEIFWIDSNEINRCGYYYFKISEYILKHSAKSIIVNYDRFILEPKNVIQQIIIKFHLTMTNKTYEILSTVRRQKKHVDNYYTRLSKNLYNNINEISDKLNEKCI